MTHYALNGSIASEMVQYSRLMEAIMAKLIELAPDHPKLDAALWKLRHPSCAQTAFLK